MLNIPFTIESDKALNIEDFLPKIPNSIILKTIEKKELTADEEILIQKVNNAAENALTPLPLGISAIGELLAYSAKEVTSETIQNIGWLIESLGRQMFALNNLVEMSESTLTSSKELKGGKGGLMS